jgi:hypothetical protein
MKKAEALARWKRLDAIQPILPHMEPIPYKADGSTYGACGIRIDGNPAFVDAVLSRLQDMIAGENGVTRLGLSRRDVDSKFKPCHNRAQNAEVCYIRLHERGGEAQIMNARYGNAETRAATRDYATALGVEV